MGRFTVDIDDRQLQGRDASRRTAAFRPIKVPRGCRSSGLVDSGATQLVIAQEPRGSRLGLPSAGKGNVRYADHRRATARRESRTSGSRCQGREGSLQRDRRATTGTDVLIGAIVLEDLDLLVDCGRQQSFVPRDPDNWSFPRSSDAVNPYPPRRPPLRQRNDFAKPPRPNRRRSPRG